MLASRFAFIFALDNMTWPSSCLDVTKTPSSLGCCARDESIAAWISRCSFLSLPCRKQNKMHIKHLFLTLFAVLCLGLTLQAQSIVGNATYYGDKWHGRRAADGSIFNQDSLTCAHKTLPFGTILHVRNPKNGKEVVVKVTDRGPYRRNTIIDLSKAAAREIDMIRSGVAQVEVTLMGRGVPAPNSQTNEENILPELQLLDPVTGNYYTMTEWKERGEKRKQMAKRKAERHSKFLAKKQQPRYRILNANTAQVKQTSTK